MNFFMTKPMYSVESQAYFPRGHFAGKLTRNIPGIVAPQRLQSAGNYLFVTSSTNGGNFYQINVGSSK